MPKLVVSSDHIVDRLPATRHAAAWCDRFQECLGRTAEITVQKDVPFRAHFEAVPLDDISVFSARGTFIGVSRSKATVVADGSDCLNLVYNQVKPFRIVQGKREIVLPTGSATLFSEAATGAFDCPPGRLGEDQTGALQIRLPRAALAEAVGNPEDRLLLPLDAKSEPLRVLKSYVDTLMAMGGTADPATARSIKEHLIDLGALALGASRDAATVARQRGWRAGRLNEVLAAINAGYRDPAFSLGSVAQSQRVSERYLRDLLHESGAGFAERVMELRLQHAHRLLTHWRHGRRKIIDIALTAGFSDLSYFNRRFRARFGMTPGDARVVAAQGTTDTLQ